MYELNKNSKKISITAVVFKSVKELIFFMIVIIRFSLLNNSEVDWYQLHDLLKASN